MAEDIRAPEIEAFSGSDDRLSNFLVLDEVAGARTSKCVDFER